MKILFVCLGNICRSPMAEFVMKKLVGDAGMSDQFEIRSAATSTYELGNPVYPPARAQLAAHGIDCSGKHSVVLQKSDYETYDLLIGMDHSNIRNIKRICGGDPEGKIRLLMSYTGVCAEVDDPWITGDYATAYNDIFKGCTALLQTLIKQL